MDPKGYQPNFPVFKEKFKWEVIDGLFCPSFITKDQVEKLKNFPLRSDDVFISTYPKSGTHWLIQILNLIIHKGVDDHEETLATICPWLEAIKIPGECYYLSHLYTQHIKYTQFPFQVTQETRYMMRPARGSS